MKSKILASALFAAAAVASVGASAQPTYNSWLFDQMSAPSSKTRAEVKAEVVQDSQNKQASASSYNGAVAQESLPTQQVQRPSLAPQASAQPVVIKLSE